MQDAGLVQGELIKESSCAGFTGVCRVDLFGTVYTMHVAWGGTGGGEVMNST